MSYTIKIFFSEPGQRYAVVGSLKVRIADTGTESALEVLIKEAMSLQADAIIFKKAPSDSHIRSRTTLRGRYSILPARERNDSD